MRLPILLATLGLASGPLAAQTTFPVSVEAGLATVGAYIAPGYQFNERLKVRAPLYYFSTGTDFEAYGSDVDADVEFFYGSVMADFYPFYSGFHISAGLAFGGIGATANTDTLELNGTSYSGDFEATLDQEQDIAPVVTVGYTRDFGSGWALNTRFGVIVATQQLEVSGQEEALSGFDLQEFEDDLDSVNDDLSSIGVVPLFSMGVSYAF